MGSPPMATYILPNSKKRLSTEGTSPFWEPDVEEIAPPISWNSMSKSKSLKQKREFFHEVIDVDMDEDCFDVMYTDGKIDSNNKGKEVLVDSLFNPSSTTTTKQESVEGFPHSLKAFNPGLHSMVNPDGTSSNCSYGDSIDINMNHDDSSLDDDPYHRLQSYFDNMDVPPGVEAPVPWLLDPCSNSMTLSTTSSSTPLSLGIESDAAGIPPVPEFSHSTWTPNPTQRILESTSSTDLGFQTPPYGLENLDKSDVSSFQLFVKPCGPSQRKKKSTASGSSSFSNFHKRVTGSFPVEEPFKSRHGDSTFVKRKHHFPTSTSSYSSNGHAGGFSFSNGTNKQVGNGGSSFYMQMDVNNVLSGVEEDSIPDLGGFLEFPMTVMEQDPTKFFDASGAGNMFPGEMAYSSWDSDPYETQQCATASASVTMTEDEIFEKFDAFKKFDTVQDHSDHHYSNPGSSAGQPSKNWAKKIQEEWKILEKDLPDTIFVRVYESRMDLLRAVIVGAEGTPYHDGLFFFDVFFPTTYPNVPPHVWYHSGGVRINPNLYNNGKVCLSLLNTWSGNHREKWIPGVSTMLQVLVSIQGLILNAKPFFNEPGYASMAGSVSGEKRSLQYNESTFILSLKTMVYSMRKPPKHFEDLVVGHFHKRAHDILVACKAYMDGAQVGCLVKGGIQDVDEGDKSCSHSFKTSLMGFTKTLVKAFARIGVKDCEKFLAPVQKS